MIHICINYGIVVDSDHNVLDILKKGLRIFRIKISKELQEVTYVASTGVGEAGSGCLVCKAEAHIKISAQVNRFLLIIF